MIDTVVVIPTRFNESSLEDLLQVIMPDTSIRDVHIYDNGMSQEFLQDLSEYYYNKYYNGPRFSIFAAHDKSIYQMWNKGIRTAIEMYGSPTNVAILNDDCIFPEGTIGEMAKILRSVESLAAVCPDYDLDVSTGIQESLWVELVTSTFGHKGLAGFCFMVRGELFFEEQIPYIDETFGWFYGDDDLAKQIISHGYKMGKIHGLPVFHEPGGSSRHLNLEPQIEKDRIYFNQKYGESRSRW